MFTRPLPFAASNSAAFDGDGIMLAIPRAVFDPAEPCRVRMSVQLPDRRVGCRERSEAIGVLLPVPGVLRRSGLLQDAVPLAWFDLGNVAFALAAHDFLRAGGFTTHVIPHPRPP